jgi:hypothetical protein
VIALTRAQPAHHLNHPLETLRPVGGSKLRGSLRDPQCATRPDAQLWCSRIARTETKAVPDTEPPESHAFQKVELL